MLDMLRDLVAHKGHANAAVLNAIRQNAAAVSDPELWELLHHVLVANRFWLLAILGSRFVYEDESRSSHSFDALVQRYVETQAQESAWLVTAVSGLVGEPFSGGMVSLWLSGLARYRRDRSPACGRLSRRSYVRPRAGETVFPRGERSEASALPSLQRQERRISGRPACGSRFASWKIGPSGAGANGPASPDVFRPTVRNRVGNQLLRTSVAIAAATRWGRLRARFRES